MHGAATAVCQGRQSCLADSRDGDCVLIPVNVDLGDRRRQPFTPDGAPQSGHGAFHVAFEDGSNSGLLLGTGRRIDIEPGLTVSVMKITRPVGEHGKLRAGKAKSNRERMWLESVLESSEPPEIVEW